MPGRVSWKENNLLRISIKICSHLARTPWVFEWLLFSSFFFFSFFFIFFLFMFFFFISCRLSIRGGKQMPASTGARQRTSWAWQGVAMRRCKWRVSRWKRAALSTPPLPPSPLHATCPEQAATSLSSQSRAGYARVCVFNILNWCWFLPELLLGLLDMPPGQLCSFFCTRLSHLPGGCGTAHLTN